MRQVFAALSEKTGLIFELPVDTDYTDKMIPNFVCNGTGYQCLQQIASAFGLSDSVWFQQLDQSIFFGEFKDSRFYSKPVKRTA